MEMTARKKKPYSQMKLCILRLIRTHNENNSQAFNIWAGFLADQVQEHEPQFADRVRRSIIGEYGEVIGPSGDVQ
jgi:hypothetical protein